MLREMNRLSTLGLPILAGMSRKRMIFQPLGTNPDGSLNGTTVVNTLALMNGASILRVHDVKAQRRRCASSAATRLNRRNSTELQ